MRSFAACLALVTSTFVGCTLDFGKWEGSANGGATAAGGAGAEGARGGAGGGPASCSNGVEDGTETDVDCGGDCSACDNGDGCEAFDDCASLFCDAGTCAVCSDSTDCAAAAGTWCDGSNMGGTCVPTKAIAVTCANNDECTSRFCADNVCCDVACDGTCESCIGSDTTSGVTGTCAAVVPTTDPGDECAAQVCGGGNTCVDLCGLQPAPPGGTCPAACNGGCAGGVCTVNCAAGTCSPCPAGFACNVVCAGVNACNGAVISCPSNYACSVACSANSGCRDAVVNCSATGTCAMTCSADANVCTGATMNCGGNDCQATCGGASTPALSSCPNGCTCAGC